MTHLSPPTLLFCTVCVGVGFVYFVWHSWNFDRFQSLAPSKRGAFKCGITWSMVLAYAMFGIWSAGMAYIKYNVGFVEVPQLGSIPTPYRRWPESYKSVTPALYYILIVAWGMLISIHVEESCFWVYLTDSIRGRTCKTWFSSLWFTLWVSGSITGIGTLLAVAIPFTDDPQSVETHIFFVGTVFTLLFTLASVYVIVRFPILMSAVRDQGGSQLVLDRLGYFRRLTRFRIVSRALFIGPFMTVSVDGLTPHRHVAEKQVLTDMFIMLGVFGLFATTILSIFMFFPPSYTAGEASDDDLASVDLLSTHDGIRPSKAYRSEMGPASAFDNEFVSGSARRPRPDTEKRPSSRISIVAPFATPPLDSRQTPLPAAQLEVMTDPSRERLGWSGQASYVGRSPANSSRALETEAAESSSAYAWNLLADHLRIPANALGSIGQATEMNLRVWQAARDDAERVLYPGMVGDHFPHISDRARPASSGLPAQGIHSTNEQTRPPTTLPIAYRGSVRSGQLGASWV